MTFHGEIDAYNVVNNTNTPLIMSKQKKKASRNGRAKNTRGPQNAPHFASAAPSSFTEVHKIGLTRLMIAERPNSCMAVELIREWLVVSPEWDRHVTVRWPLFSWSKRRGGRLFQACRTR